MGAAAAAGGTAPLLPGGPRQSSDRESARRKWGGMATHPLPASPWACPTAAPPRPAAVTSSPVTPPSGAVAAVAGVCPAYRPTQPPPSLPRPTAAVVAVCAAAAVTRAAANSDCRLPVDPRGPIIHRRRRCHAERRWPTTPPSPRTRTIGMSVQYCTYSTVRTYSTVQYVRKGRRPASVSSREPSDAAAFRSQIGGLAQCTQNLRAV